MWRHLWIANFEPTNITAIHHNRYHNRSSKYEGDSSANYLIYKGN